jgi:hypothetical protein
MVESINKLFSKSSKVELYFLPLISTIGKLYSILGAFGKSKYPYKIRRDCSSNVSFFPLNILQKKEKENTDINH